MEIPFSRPKISESQIDLVAQTLRTAKKLSGDGPLSKDCQGRLKKITQAGKALLTTSCTDALEMTALLLDLKPGDEIIMPSFTFVSTANAYCIHGAKPIFVDIRPDTLNLNEQLVEAAITESTRAIVVVHYAGVACEMDPIMAIAKEHKIVVIEDNAHGLFGSYKKRPLGSIGHMATLSFHETKNITCGEGGALLLNDERYFDRAEIIREKGTDRSRFLRGEIDKYSWVDVGSSYLPSEILAALLAGQLAEYESTQVPRGLAWDYYQSNLREWAEENGVQLPSLPVNCSPAYHIYPIVLPSEIIRDYFLAYMREHKIGSTSHYHPLHLSKMGLGFGGKRGQCPVTEDISGRLARLPMHSHLTEVELKYIVETIKCFTDFK